MISTTTLRKPFVTVATMWGEKQEWFSLNLTVCILNWVILCCFTTSASPTRRPSMMISCFMKLIQTKQCYSTTLNKRPRVRMMMDRISRHFTQLSFRTTKQWTDLSRKFLWMRVVYYQMASWKTPWCSFLPQVTRYKAANTIKSTGKKLSINPFSWLWGGILARKSCINTIWVHAKSLPARKTVWSKIRHHRAIKVPSMVSTTGTSLRELAKRQASQINLGIRWWNRQGRAWPNSMERPASSTKLNNMRTRCFLQRRVDMPSIGARQMQVRISRIQKRCYS